MKKLLVFHPALAPYRVDFFNALEETFEASFYFSLTNVSDQKFDQLALKEKCSFKCNYITSGFEFLGRSFRIGITGIIKKECPDIILCSEYGPVTLIVFLYKYFLRKKFKVYTISDDSVDNSKTRKGFRLLFRNIISRNINGVIFPSQEVCNWYHTNVSSVTKTLVLPIIHSDDVFQNELEKSIPLANKYYKEYDLEGKKIILFVGRLVTVKNLPFLINVLSQLKLNDWIMIFVGGGVLMDQLKKQVEQLDLSKKVIFTDRKEGIELLAWYLVAHIFVLPSTYEPFGAVINEALIGGCFVLCSELAGASSLINSQNGYLFNPYNENDLKDKLEMSLKLIKPHNQNISLRQNKMSFSFNEKFEMLISNL